MKKISTFCLLLILPCLAIAQQGVIKESLTLDSEILDKEVEYSIYLPDGYQTSDRRYPVLYLLHGFSDDETGWTQFGEVRNIAARETKKVDVTSMIIVMPDAGKSWYINNHDESVRYEDFFVEEFIAHVDNNYRTRPEKQFRAVAGLSMGGYGSLIMGMKHPDLFAAVAPLSAGVSTDEEFINTSMDNWNHVYGIPFGEDVEREERLSDHYLENSVLNIVETGDPEKLRSVQYYISCGDDDFLIKGNMALHSAMIDKEIPHEFRVRDGGHTWSYWRTALPEVLNFVSQSFHR